MITTGPIYAENYIAIEAELNRRFGALVTTGSISGAEIGVRHGVFSINLLKAIPALKLLCVDPYAPYHDVYEYYDTERQQRIFEEAKASVAEFAEAERLELVRKFSYDVAQNVPDSSLDFVFIDALHTYEGVKEDLQAWMPKIKKGGFLSGHDFGMDGVNKAVKELGKNIIHYPRPADVWVINL